MTVPPVPVPIGLEDLPERATPEAPDDLDLAPEYKPKRAPNDPNATKILDWTKFTPRKVDEFGSAPAEVKLPPVTQAIRDFVNKMRQEGNYDILYPVISCKKRNTAQSHCTRVNKWREAKSNTFGLRDSENLVAKVQKTSDTETFLWVGLMHAETILPEWPKPEGQ